MVLKWSACRCAPLHVRTWSDLSSEQISIQMHILPHDNMEDLDPRGCIWNGCFTIYLWIHIKWNYEIIPNVAGIAGDILVFVSSDIYNKTKHSLTCWRSIWITILVSTQKRYNSNKSTSISMAILLQMRVSSLMKTSFKQSRQLQVLPNAAELQNILGSWTDFQWNSQNTQHTEGVNKET